MDSLHALSLSALALSLDSSVAVSPPRPRPAPLSRRSSRPRRKTDDAKKTPGDKGSLVAEADDSNKENEDPEGKTPPPLRRTLVQRNFGLEVRCGLEMRHVSSRFAGLDTLSTLSTPSADRFVRQRSKPEQPVLGLTIYQDAF